MLDFFCWKCYNMAVFWECLFSGRSFSILQVSMHKSIVNFENARLFTYSSTSFTRYQRCMTTSLPSRWYMYSCLRLAQPNASSNMLSVMLLPSSTSTSFLFIPCTPVSPPLLYQIQKQTALKLFLFPCVS